MASWMKKKFHVRCSDTTSKYMPTNTPEENLKGTEKVFRVIVKLKMSNMIRKNNNKTDL